MSSSASEANIIVTNIQVMVQRSSLDVSSHLSISRGQFDIVSVAFRIAVTERTDTHLYEQSFGSLS
jgi:hypothetical protein